MRVLIYNKFPQVRGLHHAILGCALFVTLVAPAFAGSYPIGDFNPYERWEVDAKFSFGESVLARYSSFSLLNPTFGFDRRSRSSAFLEEEGNYSSGGSAVDGGMTMPAMNLAAGSFSAIRMSSPRDETPSPGLVINGVAPGSSAFSIDSGRATTITSVISGEEGPLVKTGQGTLILTGGNSYAGGTTVNAGTLLVNNSTGIGTGTGEVVVNAGGTLGGFGRVGEVLVNEGATLAPGSQANADMGIFQTGSLTLAPNSILSLNLSGGTGLDGLGAGSLYDQVQVTGALLIEGTLSLVLSGPLAAGDKFFILLNDGTDSIGGGGFSNVTNGIYTQDGYVFSVNYFDGLDGNDVSVSVTTAPEPSTWVAGFLAILAAAYQGKRLRAARVAAVCVARI